MLHHPHVARVQGLTRAGSSYDLLQPITDLGATITEGVSRVSNGLTSWVAELVSAGWGWGTEEEDAEEEQQRNRHAQASGSGGVAVGGLADSHDQHLHHRSKGAGGGGEGGGGRRSCSEPGAPTKLAAPTPWEPDAMHHCVGHVGPPVGLGLMDEYHNSKKDE